MTGSYILLESLLKEEVETIFGYPGGQIIPVFDALYDYKDKLNHILVRHEQGATHAAQGYARVSGKPGVVLLTSGPGATNAITGIADAMMDSTPMVVIAGQVPTEALGSDAFQETDLVGITQPITKWSYQIRSAKDIAWAVARAFYIATTGRPGPVVLDFTKNAQNENLEEFTYQKCQFIRSYIPNIDIDDSKINEAVSIINNSKRPLAIIGQGVILANAEEEVLDFLEKGNIPAATTLMGLSAIPTDHPLNKGMVGMHGNVGPNMMTNQCDVLIAIGMRFSDRVTGNLKTYAKQAKVIHFDIDPCEIGKNVKPTVGVLGDVKKTIKAVYEKMNNNVHYEWINSFATYENREQDKVVKKEINPIDGRLHMGEVVRKVSEASNKCAVLVTDVGQNQIMATRYFQFSRSRSVITSGGLGTMGFGLPAAIGAKIGAPERTVCCFCGDGGFQMTLQELGTILQSKIGVKIIVLNNNKLGMVRQWQELFFNERYSFTDMINPDFTLIAKAYGIGTAEVNTSEELDSAIKDMFKDNKPYLLVANVEKKGLVFPMTPGGTDVTNILLEKKQ